MSDRCPTWGPYRFHRYPCPLAGQIDTRVTTPAPEPTYTPAAEVLHENEGAHDGNAE